MSGVKSYTLQQVMDDKQLQQVVKACTGEDTWELVSSELRQAVDGLAGFLGDHIRIKLHVRVGGDVRTLRLFLKRMPVGNKPKADFIDDNDFFRREVLMFQLADELRGAEGPHPWCTKAYYYSECCVVMPDLSADGYATQPLLETYDLPHTLATVASLARFHATVANYEARRNTNGHSTILQDHGHILKESVFVDGPWVHAAAKLTANILKQFSSKYSKSIEDLEGRLDRWFVEACGALQEYEGTLNVLVHRDLWNNNIMFQHKDGAPTNTILIDFQCLRYAPPAFDLMIFLYLATSRSFREHHEKQVCHHYYTTFCENLEDMTKNKLKVLGYDEQEFVKWCEAGRQFAIFEALAIYPFILMDAKTAERTFDDPATYHQYMYSDRSAPVLAHAHTSHHYRERQLHTAEEFVERYILHVL